MVLRHCFVSTYRYITNDARRFHINSEYHGCAGDVGWLTVVDSDPTGRCGWETDRPRPQFLYSKSKTMRNWNSGWFLKNDTFDNNCKCIHMLCFFFSFSIFFYRWHWVGGYACDIYSDIGVRVVKLHTLIKSKHNGVKDINNFTEQKYYSTQSEVRMLSHIGFYM